MTTPQAANPASTLAATVGRYFTVISVVPSLLLVAFIVVLAKSGAWTKEPDFAAGVRSLTELGLGGTFALILAALALGAVLHPLQFALAQFLEGYWGVTPFWRTLRENRVRHHMRRRNGLDEHADDERVILEEHDEAVKTKAPDRLGEEELAVHESERIAAERLWSRYPADVRFTMPTRLGNVLMAAEKRAGGAIGLDIIDFGPHLMMVAPRAHVDYVNDQRTALDLAIRTCLVCILGFAAAILYLWPHGLWLLVALIPLALAWVCYEGAVTAAREYGAALRMLLDLNRFALYEYTRLPQPANTNAERALITIMHSLSTNEASLASITYRHPPPAPPGSAAGISTS